MLMLLRHQVEQALSQRHALLETGRACKAEAMAMQTLLPAAADHAGCDCQPEFHRMCVSPSKGSSRLTTACTR